jgi:hypothetical protein
MHLVTNFEGYAAAVERGIPFYYTACGGAFPVSQLTTDVRHISCGNCSVAAPEISSAPMKEPAPPAASDLVNDETFADFAEVEDLLGLDLDPETTVDQSEAPGANGGAGAMDHIGTMLEMVLQGYSPELEEWGRWLIPSNKEDPSGKLGERTMDLRDLLHEEELQFLGQLGQLSSMIGSDGLAMRVLAIIHRLADELGASIDKAGLVVEDDAGDDDVKEEA